MVRTWIWPVAGTLLCTACGEDATCPPVDVAAISVHALSTINATPVLDARGEVRDGNYADSLREVGQGYYEAAQDRPGTYTLHLEQPSYESWDTSGVQVISPGGSCPLIESTRIEARLAPLESSARAADLHPSSGDNPDSDQP